MATRTQRKKDGTPDLRYGANRTKRNTTTRSATRTNKRTTMRGGARGR